MPYKSKEYAKKYQADWYQKNKEEVLENSRKWYLKNKEYSLERHKKYYQENTERCKEGNRKRHFKQAYGITFEDYERMYFNQEGKCAICHKFCAILCVDHNHETGEIRGLLCRECNVALGFFEENILVLENAINYLEVNKR